MDQAMFPYSSKSNHKGLLPDLHKPLARGMPEIFHPSLLYLAAEFISL
jgi:hypothetical protein